MILIFNSSGKCTCKEWVIGDKCTECASEHYGFPNCQACMCSPEGSENNLCNTDTGHCYCKAENIGGNNCEKCAARHFGYPDCHECVCNAEGSVDDTCDNVTGKCPCRPNVAGLKCDKCEIGFFGFPDCERNSFKRLYPIHNSNCNFTACNCNDDGSRDVACDDNTGKCPCKSNIIGDKCEFCSPGFFGFPSCRRIQQCFDLPYFL